VNTLQLERMYETHLTLETIEHSDTTFTQFLQKYGEKICPDHGDITYVDGKVECSVHYRDDGKENDDDDGSVPFL
jgi:hypothetical protein